MELFCIDESGSINNSLYNPRSCFVIALVREKNKKCLQRRYRNFVKNNMSRLRELDLPLLKDGKVVKEGGKMFLDGNFHELKGSQFDANMKRLFADTMAKDAPLELFYICLKNPYLTDAFCQNTARAFNYAIKLNFEYLFNSGLLPKDEDYVINIDERNERTGARNMLEEYLNTEFSTGGVCSGSFKVQYYDSANNKAVQIADVFSNLYYSNVITGGAYETVIESLRERGIIKNEFIFPIKPKKS